MTKTKDLLEMVTVKLNRNDWGQIVDGLRERAGQYRNAERYHATGYVPDEDGMMAEAADEDEARAIAEHYEAIIRHIEGQLE